MFLPNRNGDDAGSRVCSLKRLSSGPITSRSIAWCFTLRTKAGRFTRSQDSSPATKCASWAIRSRRSLRPIRSFDYRVLSLAEKLQLGVNAQQRTARWRFRTEITNEAVPCAQLHMADAAGGAIHEHGTDRRGERI